MTLEREPLGIRGTRHEGQRYRKLKYLGLKPITIKVSNSPKVGEYQTLQSAMSAIPLIVQPGQKYVIDVTGYSETLPENDERRASSPRLSAAKQHRAAAASLLSAAVEAPHVDLDQLSAERTTRVEV